MDPDEEVRAAVGLVFRLFRETGSAFDATIRGKRVTFSEAVNSFSASQTANYRINNGVIVISAAAASDGRTVSLTTTPLTPGVTYQLGVNGIQDRAAGAPAAGDLIPQL